MARITSKQAKEMNEAYAKVHQNLQERVSLKDKWAAKQAAEAETNRQAAEIEKNNPGALKRSFGGAIKNNNTSNNTSVRDASIQPGRDQPPVARDGSIQQGRDKPPVATPASGNQSSSGGQQTQSGVNRSQTVVRDGNRTTTTTRTSADDTTPAGAKAVQDFKAQRAARLERLRSGGGLRPDGQGPSTGGTPPSTGGGGTETGGKKPGLLGRLGSLAGRAVGSARNVASNVKQGAQAAASNVKQGAQAAANTARNAVSGIKQAATSAASNIKKGAESVAGGAKRVAGGVADAATGNLTDFDKRGGKPQGVARVVAGGIDKLTGDRTDLDKRGPSKPVQQQEKPATGQAQEKPAQQQAQPVKKMGATEKSNRAIHGDAKIDALKAKNAEFQAARKSGNLKQYRKDNPKLSGAERAQQMARERIAAKKAAPAKPVQRKVTSVMDMEGYDPMENLFDDTVHFLVSEGHAKDKSEAISIMSESEFIDAFNKGLTEVLNEQSEG